MKKFFLFLILIAAVFLSLTLLLKDVLFRTFNNITTSTPELLNVIKERVVTPPPLISEKDAPNSYLSKDGIIEQTNLARQERGLPPLEEKEELNLSAFMKVNDIFEKQYFSHISPLGEGPSHLAQRAGYEFVAIGENLALGGFTDEKDLVAAWMQSPGHRDNILSKSYRDIGVAVLKSEYNGRTTWVAVQHFGRPLSECPQPSANLLSNIQGKQSKVEALYLVIEKKNAELKDLRKQNDPVYDKEVERYNELVSEYNNLIGELKHLIEFYNNQVRKFNECLQE